MTSEPGKKGKAQQVTSDPGKKGKEVRDGERHIYPNVESCPAASGSHHRVLQDCPKDACIHPRVLTNTCMRNTGCWHHEKNTSKKENTKRREKYKGKHGVHRSHNPPSTDMPGDASAYKAPEIHSTIHVAAALAQAREKQANVPQLLSDKLDSPNTAARLNKQSSKEVNLSRHQQVFQELVSLDVSEGTLETQLRETLNLRAECVRPPRWPRDPEPQPSEVMNPEEYVRRASVTTTNRACPAATCVTAQHMTRQELASFSRLVRDLIQPF